VEESWNARVNERSRGREEEGKVRVAHGSSKGLRR
jgi:hypothetical protein